MTLFQYWDREAPPAQVSALMDGVRSANPECRYRRFNRDTAAAFVAQRFGLREAGVFDACAVPAMQADVLRLFLLAADGGLWIDADHLAREPLASLTAGSGPLLMTEWLGFAGTGVFGAARPADPFIAGCLSLVLDNIDARRFGNVFFATGPIVCNAVRYVADPACRPALDFVATQAPWPTGAWARSLDLARGAGLALDAINRSLADLTLLSVADKERWLELPACAYKGGPDHWENWSGSIYRDPVG